MKTMTRGSVALACRATAAVMVSAFALAAAPAVARAEERAGTSWWIEGRPWTCSDPVALVARQTELACDASGGRCRVAGDQAHADRTAALTCVATDAWRLDAEDRAGHVIWSVTLTGDEDARARKAALWIARAESEGPQGATEEVTQSPAQAPAPAPVPATTVAPAPASAPAPVTTPAAPPAERDVDRSEPTHSDEGVMTVSLFSGEGAHMAGARFATALKLTGNVYGGLAIDGVTSPGEVHPDTYAHLGALLAFGAPYSLDWIGVAAEGGPALYMKWDHALGASQPPVTHAYAKGTVVVQIPRDHGVRPYLALSYLASDDAMNRTVLADLGLAWGAW